MCYRSAQSFDFRDSSLWMLTGRNGAGKSTVFDAMRWALFGVHRGGMQGNNALVHHDAGAMKVEFTFALGSETVRVTRTQTRGGKSSRQIERDRGESYEAIPTTETKIGFEDWIDNVLGLSGATFCSAMYLGQGRADALLDSNPKERYRVLAEIVDLSAFQRLHGAADERRIEALRVAQRAIRDEEAAPAIEDEAVQAQAAAVEAARQTRDQSAARVAHWEALRPAAAQWEKWNSEREKARSERERLEELSGDAPAIEAQIARLSWIERALPPLEKWRKSRARHAELQRQIGDNERALEALDERLKNAKGAENAARQSVEDERENLDAASENLQAATQTAAELRPQGERIAQLENARAQLRQRNLELARLPADAQAQARELSAQIEDREALQGALPHFVIFAQARTRWRQARAALPQLAGQTPPPQKLEAANNRLERSQSALLQAQEALAAKRDAATLARAALESARAAQSRFADVEGATQCYVCQQPLTPAHAAREAARLQTEVEEAERAHVDAEAAQGSALAASAQAQRELKRAQREFEALQEAQIEATRAREALRRDEQSALQSAGAARQAIGAQWAIRGGAPPNRAANGIAASRNTTNSGAFNSNATSDSTTSGNATSESATSGGATSGRATSEGATSGRATSEGATSESATSGSATSENVMGNSATSNSATSGSAAKDGALNDGPASNGATNRSAMRDAPVSGGAVSASATDKTMVSGDFESHTASDDEANGGAVGDDAASKSPARSDAASQVMAGDGSDGASRNGAAEDGAVRELAVEEALQREFPRAVEIEAWRQEVSALPAARAQRDQMLQQARDRADLERRLGELNEQIAPLSAQFSEARAASIGEEAARAARQIEEANAQIAATRPRLKAAEAAFKAAQTQRENAQREREPLANDLAQGRGELATATRGLQEQRAELAPDLLSFLDRDDVDAELASWRAEKARLEGADLRARAEKLAQARAQIERLEARIGLFDEQIEGLSPQAQRAVAGIDGELRDARDAREHAAAALENAARELANLEAARARKTELGRARVEAQSALRHLETLAHLLGPDKLQLYLLQEAQVGIIAQSNAILDRISGGSLRLELRREEMEVQGRARAESALDFVVFHHPRPDQKTAMTDEPHAIYPAFLSGSQRFRVAVALALGIGRYAAAGQGAARLESVMIDEGFGSLDKQGRDEMVGELRNLGHELKRVILVSHQEDFAQAFPNRYLVEHDGREARARLVSD